MSIIRKKYEEGATELNKLKFAPSMGAGHPGKPPLVTKSVPNENTNSIPSYSEVQRRADDLTRITKLFTRREGLQYLTNNTTLNTAVDQSYTIKGTVKDKLKALTDISLGAGVRDTLGTLASTLAQVPLAGTGTHFAKGVLFGSKSNPSFNRPSKATQLIGDPGSVRVKYGRDAYYAPMGSSTYAVDKVNYVGPYPGAEAKDYIKFFFEILTPGETENVLLHFRAFLDSFDDSFNANWNSLNYIGRGEKFYTYQEFDRTINVSFKSAVATKFELRPLYKKLNYLASTTAPTYSDNGIQRGTIVRMNLGDYLANTPGILTSVSYGWEPRYPFEIAAGKTDPRAPKGSPRVNSDLEVQELPHVLNCSLTFTPIHTFTPQTGLYHYITNPEEGPSQFFPVPDTNVQNNRVGTVEVGEGQFGPFGTDGIFTQAPLVINR